MSVWGVVVAAGSGTRFGRRKQFELLDGQPLVHRAIANASTACDHVVVVVPDDAVDADYGTPYVVAGAATRSGSVRAGIGLVDGADIVVVHDAARPLAPARLFADVIAAVRAGADAAVPVLPIADTVKEVEGDLVVATLDRHRLVTVQTPQAFRAEALFEAHAGCPEATDDAALVEAQGGKVVTVPGDPAATKVTSPTDLDRLAATRS